jgi:hypothetical protein
MAQQGSAFMVRFVATDDGSPVMTDDQTVTVGVGRYLRPAPRRIRTTPTPTATASAI